MIPMAKVNREAILLLTNPLHLEVEHDYPGAGAELELCVYEAANLYYYKYSVGGMNVILVSISAENFSLHSLFLPFRPIRPPFAA